ncbi:MAG: hypothetical protein DWH91_19075 [Planctomycetota bacterium]|nr:MAG: hypothetical protein DWH91_19075 [Planctomycetota bacterium]
MIPPRHVEESVGSRHHGQPFALLPEGSPAFVRGLFSSPSMEGVIEVRYGEFRFWLWCLCQEYHYVGEVIQPVNPFRISTDWKPIPRFSTDG